MLLESSSIFIILEPDMKVGCVILFCHLAAAAILAEDFFALLLYLALSELERYLALRLVNGKSLSLLHACV